MSLDSLRDLRRSGSSPDGIVKVVVGKRSPADDRPDVIAIDAGDRAQFLDWRPLVGLPFALFVCRGWDIQAEAVLDAVLEVNARPVGAAWHDVIESTDEAIKPTLRRMWELLCL